MNNLAFVLFLLSFLSSAIGANANLTVNIFFKENGYVVYGPEGSLPVVFYRNSPHFDQMFITDVNDNEIQYQNGTKDVVMTLDDSYPNKLSIGDTVKVKSDTIVIERKDIATYRRYRVPMPYYLNKNFDNLIKKIKKKNMSFSFMFFIPEGSAIEHILAKIIKEKHFKPTLVVSYRDFEIRDLFLFQNSKEGPMHKVSLAYPNAKPSLNPNVIRNEHLKSGQYEGILKRFNQGLSAISKVLDERSIKLKKQ
ncbi:MAG: hypothetical protein OCC49_01265 [Fibrobacterales bacterium]